MPISLRSRIHSNVGSAAGLPRTAIEAIEVHCLMTELDGHLV